MTGCEAAVIAVLRRMGGVLQRPPGQRHSGDLVRIMSEFSYLRPAVPIKDKKQRYLIRTLGQAQGSRAQARRECEVADGARPSRRPVERRWERGPVPGRRCVQRGAGDPVEQRVLTSIITRPPRAIDRPGVAPTRTGTRWMRSVCCIATVGLLHSNLATQTLAPCGVVVSSIRLERGSGSRCISARRPVLRTSPPCSYARRPSASHGRILGQG